MPTLQEEIDRELSEAYERMMQAVIMNLKVIGEKCVNAARITSQKGRDYTDQTGNLRSSTGYVLAVDGEIVAESSFDVVKNGQQGRDEGKSFAESLVKDHPSGIALIVVAGKNYAEYVAARGYDVLDSAELLAEQLVQKLSDDLQQQT